MQNLWFTVSSNCNQTTLQLWSVSPKETFLHHFLSISCTMNYSNLVPVAPNQVKFCLQSHQGAKWDSTPAGPLTRPRPSASYLITGGSHAAAESTNTKLNPAQDTFRIQMWTKTTWFIFPWALLPHSMITPLVPPVLSLSPHCLCRIPQVPRHWRGPHRLFFPVLVFNLFVSTGWEIPEPGPSTSRETPRQREKRDG